MDENMGQLNQAQHAESLARSQGLRAIEAVVAHRAPPAVRARTLLDSLPDVVRIGAHDYAIQRISSFHGEDRFGLCDHVDQAIRMAPHASPTDLAETFLHECLHAVWRRRALEKSGEGAERVVSTLADALVGLFRDNPWLAGWIAGAVR